MLLKGEQLAAHLERELRPLYVVYGDEPLLVIEAADAIRAKARQQGYSEYEHFDETIYGGDFLADLRAHRIELDDELRPTFLLETPWGSGPVRLAVRGAHQVTNAALAAACCFGQKGLSSPATNRTGTSVFLSISRQSASA